MNTRAKLKSVTLDCPEPKALANFYHQLTGWEISYSEETFAGLTIDEDLFLGFQRVDDYVAPDWPAQRVPQQFHLDFGVDNVEEAQAHAVELGAVKADTQPGGERWTVFLDPAGHPFCLFGA